MTPELPDDAYLRWLYGQVASVRLKNPNRTYWSLLRLLYTTEFVWFVPNDDNRAEDGRELRYEFIEETGIAHLDDEWLALNCSMLEMLIALSRRLAFEADGQARAWFWHLLHNLEIDNYTDAVAPFPERRINNVLDTVIWRTYREDGRGGLFPLKRAHENQKKVEIWYQLAAYLLQ
ncbi:MAG TPA: hypothetical protein PKI27_15170 [Dermatophilaceae bacterium]|nr:hypothetical protein [Dermatophilaceae bacterium]